MFSTQRKLNLRKPHQSFSASQSSDRRGATLVVVLALLGLMMIIGFFAYTMAGQQQANSEYFANTERAKARNVADFDRDVLFDWALEQIIKGAPSDLPHSALSGGRHALVPNMFGNDLHPYSGSGYHIILNGDNEPVLDNDYNGSADPAPVDPWLNASPAANSGSFPPFDASYTPDGSYTAPDMNNTFLGFRGYGLDANDQPVLVIKPSYHRPEMLREYDGSVRTKLVRDWMLTGTNEADSLRAHQDHVDANVTSVNRFVRDGESVDGITTPFPFPNYDEINNPNEPWSEGVWFMEEHQSASTYQFGEWVSYNNKYYKALVDGPTVDPPADGTDWKEYSQPVYSYDADPDGDGIEEAIWMDLDFPIQETPDGSRFFVPMFAVTIYDADGLLNLNAVGNMNGQFNLAGSSNFGGGEKISKSNLGLSPSEINPIWALNATDNDFDSGEEVGAKSEHTDFFGWAPDATTDPTEIANMEWFWANAVKLTFDGMGDVESEVYGRYGDDGIADISVVHTAEDRYGYPQPGTPATDDNGNVAVGDNSAAISAEDWLSVPGHPLDYLGTGDIFQTLVSPGNGKSFDFHALALSNWLKYSNYSCPTQVQWVGDVSVQTYAGSDLTNLITNALTDEAFEMEADPTVWGPLGAANTDNQFALSENGALQMSDSDIELSSTSSRLMQLMPWNLSLNNRAEEIRKNFTTHSTDIRARGASESVNRSWEVDSTTDDFPSAAAAAVMRPELADWLRVQHGELGEDFNTRSMMQRLVSLNHIIDEDASGNLYLRRLTPHPAGLDENEIDTSWIPSGRDYSTDKAVFDVDLTQTGKHLQEFWARTDRQEMARDIYVLLYMLGADTDADPFATNPYTDDEKAEMAQFAINAVNQLDRDNVIDVFEYDNDLTNGWDLDDNPYVTDGADRREVYGVEAQELAINEAYLVVSEKLEDAGSPVNLLATEWDDEVNQSHFYIELRNMLPRDLSLDNGMVADVTDNGVWRLKITASDGTDEKTEYLVLRKPQDIPAGDMYTISSTSFFDPTAATVPDDWHSEMRIDVGYSATTMPTLDFTQDADYIAPSGYGTEFLDLNTDAPTIGTGLNPLVNYEYVLFNENGAIIGENPSDLITPTQSQPYLLQSLPDNGVGGVVIELPDINTVTVVLERRLNTTRSVDDTDLLNVTSVSDNPWVEVDQFEISGSEGIFHADLNTTLVSYTADQDGADVRTAMIDEMNPPATPTISQAQSKERIEVLNRNDNALSFDPINDDADPTNDTLMIRNTIGADNYRATTDLTSGYITWQPHFDRDFASPIELLTIPLYGPDLLTNGDLSVSYPALQSTVVTPTEDGLRMDGTNTFGDEVFDSTSNRWYRLLGYVEVPRYDSDVDDSTAFKANMINSSNYRLPGKINWNTIRTPEVLAALMDEVRLYTQDLTPADGDNVYLPDANGETTRDWWVQFIKARDQVWDGATAGPDPVTGMYLPGMPGSRPFRNLDFVDDGAESIEHTMLRELPLDSGRRLFEVGNSTDDLDFPAKQRLLAKMVNNSTNRSNVFFVFIQVDFFEAREQNDGSVRIGGKMDDSPGFRSMFVVDRSLAFETLEAGDFPTTNPDNRFSLEKDDVGTTPFDWRDLVIQRLNIK